MKLALCNEVIREFEFSRQCSFAAAVGYQGLEIAPFTLGEAPDRLPASRIAETRRAAAGAGVTIAGLHWLLVAPPNLSITSPDAAIGERTREVILALVRLCAELDGEYLVHGSPAQRALAPGEETEGRRRALDLFAAAAGAAEQAGVIYCIEPLSPDQTNFITSLDEATEIVKEIGSPALRTMLDCSAAGASEREGIPSLLTRGLRSGTVRHLHFNARSQRKPTKAGSGWSRSSTNRMALAAPRGRRAMCEALPRRSIDE
jgi:D-psicose/D-tagatose/L-ribulose 3-epimerase